MDSTQDEEAQEKIKLKWRSLVDTERQSDLILIRSHNVNMMERKKKPVYEKEVFPEYKKKAWSIVDSGKEEFHLVYLGKLWRFPKNVKN